MNSAPFHVRLREERLKMPDPATGKVPISQRALSRLLELNKDAIHDYESGARVPHPLVRRELKRIFPNLFAHDSGGAAPGCRADGE